ncbi:MAG TPA: T9SS type A sorting domain-containing protein, partial [Bacteroidia bacterium]|nr:T9SS type A sorting domain-containing protein [Bacteroidia bacterium]
VQWGQCYNTPSPLYGGVLYSALPTADGDYICSGSFDYRMTLFKTDANGNVLWCRITNTPGELFDSRATSDGGYIASGYQTSYSSGSSEAVLMKTNGAGTIQWTDDYYLNTSTSSYDEGYAVVPDGSGYTALISDGYSGGRYLMHTDSAGVPAWAKNYGSVSDLSFSLEKTTDNGFLLNGYSQDYMNVVVVKTDPSGNAACDDSTLVVDHDTVSYIMDSVLTTVSATARNTPAVVFVNHTIVYQTICSANSESGVEDPGGGPPGLAVFPNPAQNSVSVRMDMLHDNSVVISVTDLSGQVVSERKETNVSGTYERTLDLSSLAGGIYFIRVQVDDQPPAVRKVVHE